MNKGAFAIALCEAVAALLVGVLFWYALTS